MTPFPQDLIEAIKQEFQGHLWYESVSQALHRTNGEGVAMALSEAAKLRWADWHLLEPEAIVRAFQEGRQDDVFKAAERSVRIEGLLLRLNEHWHQHQ
ncbi:MAG: hypothetical protein KBD29_04255 [Candidatus Magasanikbacteria bacterium]|nr:hypothetical protein [Candidatus Magasanikbacteria bacterium]